MCGNCVYFSHSNEEKLDINDLCLCLRIGPMRMKALIILMHARVVSNENIMKHEEVKVRAQSKVSKFIFIFILSMFFL